MPSPGPMYVLLEQPLVRSVFRINKRMMFTLTKYVKYEGNFKTVYKITFNETTKCVNKELNTGTKPFFTISSSVY